MTRLHILMNGEHLGMLDGRGTSVRVLYDRDLDPGHIAPLSLSMPLTKPRHRGKAVANWLTALLPDRDAVLLKWRAEFGVTDLNPESLLAHIGEDVAGACQFVRDDRMDAVIHRPRHLVPLTDDDIAGLTQAAKQDSLPYDPETETGRFSLAGAQAKFALQRVGEGRWALPSGAEPSTHIFKPAIVGLEDQDVTEVVSMRAAAQMELPAADSFIAEFAGERLVAVERYDRYFADGKWWRVHQEDMCQAAGLDPALKYESQAGPGAAAIADLLRLYCGERDVQTFARALIYNFLIKGSDAHARNYSLLLTPGDVRLAPLYDLNTTLSFGQTAEAKRMAMTIGGEHRFAAVGPGNWRLFAGMLHLDEAWVLNEVQSMAARLPGVLSDVCAASDVAGVADLTLRRLLDRSEQWCGEVASTFIGHTRSAGSAQRRAKTTEKGTSGSYAEKLLDDPGQHVIQSS